VGKLIKSYFLRISISRKLLLGYGVLLVLLIVISVYSLFNLHWLNAINNGILNSDLPVINAAEKMIGLILDQEFYAQRYRILQKKENLVRFRQRQAEFKQIAEQIASLPNDRDLMIDPIVQLHNRYSEILSEGLLLPNGASAWLAENYEQKIKTHQEKIITLIRAMATDAMRDQKQKTNMTTSIGNLAFKVSAMLCILGLIAAVTAAMLITRNVSNALKELKLATSVISKGKFDYKPKIRNKDELGDLSTAFVAMAEKLKRLEQQNLDTSPLTRLPGGVFIEKKLNQRIALNQPIAFCLFDIDNFKAFNDRYGYAKGNELIKTTAGIIRKTVIKLGSTNDFIGHIGGDDFVVLTSPTHYERICSAVIETFDKTIPNFYDNEDRQRGYIVGVNRQGQKVSFPLASISIAVVTNVHRQIVNYIQYGEIAAEIKERAKFTAGSNFMVDMRVQEDSATDSNGKLINFKNWNRSPGN
jgi:diguanylate cyclase (GGDEF)-like protein